MIAFTFNTLNRLGVFEKYYIKVSNFVNRHVLSRNTLRPDFLSDVFDAVDGFWLKHNQSKWYSESELRVIVGMLASSLRDNNLSPGEVKTITAYVVSNWSQERAQAKSQPSLPEKAEDLALKSAKVYTELCSSQPIPVEEFVSAGAKALGEGLETAEHVSNLLSRLKAK